ncbi:hypothetical protein [Nocardia yamanashiensis]|uniref:hypothetical protein n=1 Tax=Nocardia yamanashiensis TaxID=209247 RepID=UPI00082E4ECC|nr:hypothetical protein [Nocardia yamanashiensis]
MEVRVDPADLPVIGAQILANHASLGGVVHASAFSGLVHLIGFDETSTEIMAALNTHHADSIVSLVSGLESGTERGAALAPVAAAYRGQDAASGIAIAT